MEYVHGEHQVQVNRAEYTRRFEFPSEKTSRTRQRLDDEHYDGYHVRRSSSVDKQLNRVDNMM